MKALVYHARRDLRLEEVPDPVIGEGQVLLEVRTAGVCGTDAAEYEHGPRMLPIETRHPASGHFGPTIPGHEFAGRIAAVGPGVTGLEAGEWVVTGAGVWCGACVRCRSGRLNLCTRYWTLGLQADGGLAQYCAVPAQTIVRAAPYALEGDVLGLAQPMSIAVHSLRQGGSAPGETAVVVGVGGIGAFLVVALVRTGLQVIISDLDPGRRAVAMALGAAAASDPREEPPGAYVCDRGLDPAVVFEVTGTAAGLALAVETLPTGARLVAVGLPEQPREVDLRALTLREQVIIGTNAHVCPRDMPEALRLLAGGQVDWRLVAPLAVPLDRVVADGLVPLVERRAERIKTLVDPWADAPRPTAMPAVDMPAPV